MNGLVVDRPEIERIQSYSEQQLDSLPFGAICLDREGKILSFNQAEVDLSGRKKENVLGKNFFREVAPCTNVQDFAGRFRDGVARGELHTTFPYVFDYQMDPRKVALLQQGDRYGVGLRAGRPEDGTGRVGITSGRTISFCAAT